MAPIRILGLPGHGGSAQQLSGKLSRHLDIWGDDFELVSVDPVEILLPSTHIVGDHADILDSPNSAFRWWPWSSHWKYKPGELERALRYLRHVFETQGPFDAIFGFSQGSAMSVLLLALLEQPELHPIWARPSKYRDVVWPPQPVRCAILCSAFGPLDPRYQEWFSNERPTTPTLHLIGRNDTVLDPALSLETVDRLENAEVHWHDGGHHIPRKPFWAALTRNFMLRNCGVNLGLTQLSFADLSSPTESLASSEGEMDPFFTSDKLTVLPEEDEGWTDV
ncbi:hypothetical protein JCM8202_003207 [Rhodotorula sphaerocarpa]